jgi:hypothetical protein
MPLITGLERGVPPKVEYIALRYWNIYIGVPLLNPSEGGYAGAGGLTAWGGGAREILNPWTPHPVEPLMGWAKPHTGGGPRPMYL